jgi:hypothetical protein
VHGTLPQSTALLLLATVLLYTRLQSPYSKGKRGSPSCGRSWGAGRRLDTQCHRATPLRQPPPRVAAAYLLLVGLRVCARRARPWLLTRPAPKPSRPRPVVSKSLRAGSGSGEAPTCLGSHRDGILERQDDRLWRGVERRGVTGIGLQHGYEHVP